MVDNKEDTDISLEMISVSTTYTVGELCELCKVDESELSIYIEHGIVDIETAGAKRFNHAQVDRLQRAMRLQADLEVNHAGAALALDLLDIIKTLERDIARLKR